MYRVTAINVTPTQKGELAVQRNAANSAQSIHIRLTFIAVTRYFLHKKKIALQQKYSILV